MIAGFLNHQRTEIIAAGATSRKRLQELLVVPDPMVQGSVYVFWLCVTMHHSVVLAGADGKRWDSLLDDMHTRKYTPWKLKVDINRYEKVERIVWITKLLWNMVIWISRVNSMYYIMTVIKSQLGLSNGIQPYLHSPYLRSDQVLSILSLDECIAQIFWNHKPYWIIHDNTTTTTTATTKNN